MKRVLKPNGAGRRSTSSLARAGRRSGRPLASSVKRANWRVPIAEYSTEKILKLRGSEIDPKKQAILYDANNEKDSCGVGLIALFFGTVKMDNNATVLNATIIYDGNNGTTTVNDHPDIRQLAVSHLTFQIGNYSNLLVYSQYCVLF